MIIVYHDKTEVAKHEADEEEVGVLGEKMKYKETRETRKENGLVASTTIRERRLKI